MKTPSSPCPVERSAQSASGFVQWDETPSLADPMSWRLQRAGDGNGPVVNFADAMPAALLPVQPATQFSEPVDGLSVREITDDDLFVHLFGKSDVE